MGLDENVKGLKMLNGFTLVLIQLGNKLLSLFPYFLCSLCYLSLRSYFAHILVLHSTYIHCEITYDSYGKSFAVQDHFW